MYLCHNNSSNNQLQNKNNLQEPKVCVSLSLFLTEEYVSNMPTVKVDYSVSTINTPFGFNFPYFQIKLDFR